MTKPSKSQGILEGNTTLTVVKRDGSLQEFDEGKLKKAITAACSDVGKELVLSAEDLNDITIKCKAVAAETNRITVEQLQDLVEIFLMQRNHSDIAKAYILWRASRSKLRVGRLKPDNKAIADYIHSAKYAKYLPDKKRRELYSETVDRRKAMDLEKYPNHKDIIDWTYQFVYDKKILPSMRSMQFGGKAILANNNRMFNCSFTLMDRVRAFSEVFHLLLSGCGVGYSIQWRHVNKLPPVMPIQKLVKHHIIQDDIAGWAEALNALMTSYFKGEAHVEFAYHLIRDEGKELKTSGGKAPGHLPLKKMLEAVRFILKGATGRQLRPIEIHDILCITADAVLAGGIRRSAMISLFSIDDGEMMMCKTGNWYTDHPYRRCANNSVVLLRTEAKKEQFERVFKCCKEFGEPGFIFTNNYDTGFNPCGEANIDPNLVITPEVRHLIRDWEQETGQRALVHIETGEPTQAPGDKNDKAPKGYRKPKANEVLTGFGFCNLGEVNMATVDSPEDMMDRGKASAILGTMQVGYNKLEYLTWVSTIILRREALLGVGLTGMMANPKYAFDPVLLEQLADTIVDTNLEMSKKIGVRSTARATVIKPSGTASLELGGVPSGIHPYWARRFFRRVTANPNEPPAKHFNSINPHMVEVKPDGDWAIVFPMEVGDDAITNEQVNGVEFLKRVSLVYKHYIKPGTARPESSSGANHNVSSTCPVINDKQWEDVAAYLWKNREDFGAVSFLAYDGDKKYAFAPNEKIVTSADEARWNYLIENYKPVDYSLLIENEDTTKVAQEPACAGGACEIQ